MVQYADIAPTLLEAAGGDVRHADFDGSSFLPVLEGRELQHRRYTYGMHNNIPEGPAYPIRSVSNGRYRYIRNLRPEEIYIEKHVMGVNGDGGLNNPYWSTWVWEASTNQHTYDLVKRYTRRPPEELYDTQSDPYEMTNRIDDESLAEIKAELQAELHRWMQEQSDPGAAQDTPEAHQAAKKQQHLYGPGITR